MRLALSLTILALAAGEIHAQVIRANGRSDQPAGANRLNGASASGQGAQVYRSRPTVNRQAVAGPQQNYVPGGNGIQTYPYPTYAPNGYRQGYGYYPYSAAGNSLYPTQPRQQVSPPGGNLNPQVNRVIPQVNQVNPQVNRVNPQVNQPAINRFDPGNSLSVQDVQSIYRQRELAHRREQYLRQQRRLAGEDVKDDPRSPQAALEELHRSNPTAQRFFQGLYGQRQSAFNQSQYGYSVQGQSTFNQNQYGYSFHGQRFVSPTFYNGSSYNQSVFNQSQPNYSLHNVARPGTTYRRY